MATSYFGSILGRMGESATGTKSLQRRGKAYLLQYAFLLDNYYSACQSPSHSLFEEVGKLIPSEYFFFLKLFVFCGWQAIQSFFINKNSQEYVALFIRKAAFYF